MIVELLENTLAFLFIVAFILHILHFEWFKKYVSVVTYPILHVSQIFIGLIYGMILITPKILVGFLKAILIAVLTVVLALVYLATFVVPYVGERAEGWRKSLKYSVVLSYLSGQIRAMRGIMVRIVAEEDDRDLKFEDAERYRTELSRVKQDGKDRLEVGAALMSILLGALLLTTRLAGVNLLQSSIYGIPIDLLIEGWLLFISVSIIYRTSVLELLSYGPNDRFESLEEMDAALGYQKGVSLVGFFQGLVFLLTFITTISRVQYVLVEDALRSMYKDEPWIALTWKKLVK